MVYLHRPALPIDEEMNDAIVNFTAWHTGEEPNKIRASLARYLKKLEW